MKRLILILLLTITVSNSAPKKISDIVTTLTVKQGAAWLMESWEYLHDEP